MEKKLGKISSAHFGLGGYQDAMIGLHLTFTSDGIGVSASISAWDSQLILHTESCKWTEEDRSNDYDKIVRCISELLKQANVDRVDKLKNIPVELTFDGNLLKDWRILTEVL